VREENDKVKAEMGEGAYAEGRYEDAASSCSIWSSSPSSKSSDPAGL
jgi:hypothetical protein